MAARCLLSRSRTLLMSMKSASGWHPFDEVRGLGEIHESFIRRKVPDIEAPLSPQSGKSINRNRRKRTNLIKRLAKRDGGRKCSYCKKELEVKYCTIDHVIPRSRGGKDSFENYVIACHPCNNGKGSKILKDGG